MNFKKTMGLALLCLILPALSWAQTEAKFLVVTTVHVNLNAGHTLEEWKAVEKEYFDKVTKKNDLIYGSNVLVHFYTDDNSEIRFAYTYRTWDDIEKADAKSDELAKAAWPDETARKAFFKKQRGFYTSEHSDEIYSILPGTKTLAATAPESIYYIRTSHRLFPEDGTPEEYKALNDEMVNNITLKNPLLKGYYPSRHLWGADGREVVQTFVYSSLADMEKTEQEQEKLIKAYWPDETKRKDFFAKLNKYAGNWHGDEIFRHVPELRKTPVASPAATK
jgi:hypothetical protein